jgi:hypothetical protein
MSLPDRKLGLIFLALLSFFSCEDPSELGLDLDPNKNKIGVHYKEISLPSSIIFTDSIVAYDNRLPEIPYRQRLLVGTYQDTDFGKVTATSYAQLRISGSVIPENAEYDSIVFHFKPNYRYGGDLASGFTFSLHEILGNENDPRLRRLIDSTYLTRDVLAVKPQSLGTGTYRPQFKKEESLQMKLNDDFGQTLFEKIRTGDEALTSQIEFLKYFKGFALVSSPENSANGVMGINPSSDSTYIRIHYQAPNDQGVKERRTYAFTVGNIGFNSIVGDRTGSTLSHIVTPHKDYTTNDDFTYVQAGSGIVGKLDLTPFFAFRETEKDIIINQAQIVIEDIPNQKNFSPPIAFNTFVANSANKLIRNGSSPLTVPLDNAGRTTSVMPYNFTKGEYSGEITSYLHALSIGLAKERAMFIYPVENSRSINMTRIPKDKIKLKIYYTKIN